MQGFTDHRRSIDSLRPAVSWAPETLDVRPESVEDEAGPKQKRCGKLVHCTIELQRTCASLGSCEDVVLYPLQPRFPCRCTSAAALRCTNGVVFRPQSSCSCSVGHRQPLCSALNILCSVTLRVCCASWLLRAQR